MIWTLIIALEVIWLLGTITSVTANGLVHLLLVLALVALVFKVLSGRRVA